MRLLIFFYILHQTRCLVYAEVCESSEKGSNSTDDNSEILNSNSFIHHLVNTAGIDFDSSRCRHELSLIKEAIREKDLWASKRK